MLPHSTGVMSLQARCHGEMGDSAMALEQSRKAVLAWPQNTAHQERFLKWADAVDNAGLSDADRALVRFLRGQGHAPPGPAWAEHPATMCSCASTVYLDVSGNERIGSHFEPVLASPIIAARCRETRAAWLFVKMRAGTYRGVRLANTSFSGPPVRTQGPPPMLFS